MLTPPIETLLPHAGRMRLIDRIVAYDDQRIVCESDSHRAADHPLAFGDTLPIACGLEYGAQAMAIHGTLLAAARPQDGAGVRHGFLVAASELRWTVNRLDQYDAPLVIEAVSEFMADQQVAYSFELRVSGQCVLTGRASVLLTVGQVDS